MRHIEPPAPSSIFRRVFPAWSVEIPESFAETFVEDDAYWHAWDDHRSVSLTSIHLTDDRGPVSAGMIARRFPRLDGSPVDDLPPGVAGRAVTTSAPLPARASQMLTGMLAAPGRLLVVTITTDDLDWARRTWLSIRTHPAPPPPLEGRSAGRWRSPAH
jgi:hypothetical protein